MSINLSQSLKNSRLLRPSDNSYGPFSILNPSGKSPKAGRSSLYMISSPDSSSQDSKFKLTPKFGFFAPLNCKYEKSNREEANQTGSKESIKDSPECENFLKIRIKNELERFDEVSEGSSLFELYQSILRIKYGISEFFRIIVKSFFFQIIVNLVILLNTVILALEDPTWVIIPPPYDTFEVFFAYFYTIEFAMLALAFGLFRYSDSYFRSWWNILDFTIIVTAWLSIYAGSGFRLSALRSLRILRPLKSIRSIKGMKAIFMALVNSIWPLLSALFILFFCIFLFSIIAVQLWMDELKGRCLILETGLIDNLSYNCGSSTCFTGEECVKTLDNPNNGVSHYDNILMAVITVFQIITLEGWTNNLVTTQTAFSYWSFLYYIPLIFITSYFIMNYTMAIIAISFKNTAKDIFQKTEANYNALLSDDLIDEIIKNTLSSSLKDSDKTRKGDDNRATDRDTLLGGFNVQVQEWNKDDYQNGSYNSKGDLEENKTSEASEENGILFSKLVDSNSALKKRSTVTTRKSFTGILGIEEKLSRQPQSSLNNLQSNLDTYQNMVSIQPDVDSWQKRKEGLKKMTIKNRTLNILKKDPKKVKLTVFVVHQNTEIESTSMKNVIPQNEKNLQTEIDFSYDTTKRSKLLTYYHFNIYKPLKKYSEFENIFSLFSYLSLRQPKKPTFFHINLKVKSFISKYRFSDIEGIWSGLDISNNEDPRNQEYAKKLSAMSYVIWSKGVFGALEKIQNSLKAIITNKHANTLMLLSVVTNTVVLSLERYGISQSEEDTLQQINIFFTYFFAVEIFLKIISLGLISFIRDLMNVFDTALVILSLVEIFILNSGMNALTAFRVIRVFRIFRVLRVLRIFRYLKSMSVIITSLGRSLSNIAYLFLLLILFQIIFTLLGMQVYGGTFNFNGIVPRGNFDSFHWAFVTTFQLLSVENWNDILTSSLRSSLGQSSCLLIISWIILGNFILLNLFLAILLDSFSDSEEDQTSLLIDKQVKLKIKKRLENIQNELDDDSEEVDMSRIRSKSTELVYLECEKSYYVFSKENIVRRLCHKISVSPYFEYIMIALILLNSVKLVIDTYIINDQIYSVEIRVSNAFDTFFTVIFGIEFIIKSVALGFALHKDSYLRDNWNKLDFCIVILSTIDLAMTSISLPIIKVFRVLRTLRPLKLIKHNLSLKIVVMALFESIVAILNVMFLILIIWLIFAILGVSLLSGKMHSCSFQSITDMDTCISSGYEWVQGRFNFDNVLEAIVVLFIIMSQESWPNRMLEGVDARGVGVTPATNYNPYMAYYYIIYLFVSNFFLLNLFTVVVFNKFNEAKRNESNLTSLLVFKEQILWSDIQSLIIKAKPWQLKSKINSRFRMFFIDISKSKKLEIVMIGFILVNMIILAMPYQEASNNYLGALDYINLICTIAFIIEAIIKIMGLGLHYFKNNWNKFDFIIVIFSTTDVVLTYAVSTSFKLLRQAPQLIRVLRIFRVFRLIRLVKQVETLEKLFTIMTYSLPAILNVLALLMLIFFIYAVLGCFLYNDVPSNIGITAWYNFSNFHNAMNILWRISTGEDYPSIMSDTVIYQQTYWNILYFTSFVTIVDFVVLELFITITLQYFEEFYMNPYNAISLFSEDLKVFKSHWTEEIQQYSYKIDNEGLVRLMKHLGVKFKFLDTDDRISIIRLIGAMNIYRDEKGFYYFNDVLYSVLRRKYEKKINKKNYRLDFTIMKIEEIKTKSLLKKIRSKYYMKERRFSVKFLSKDSGYYEFYNLKTVFSSWRNYVINSERFNNETTPRLSELDYPGENSILNE